MKPGGRGASDRPRDRPDVTLILAGTSAGVSVVDVATGDQVAFVPIASMLPNTSPNAGSIALTSSGRYALPDHRCWSPRSALLPTAGSCRRAGYRSCGRPRRRPTGSALSQIGRDRLSVAEFERRLQLLQAFLRGEEVQLPNGTSSSIRWLHGSSDPKVAVHVAATGRRTIAAGARHAEGVDLTVGAELERLRWGIATVRSPDPRAKSWAAWRRSGPAASSA